MPATLAEYEAYRMGYAAGQAGSDPDTRLTKRKLWFAAGTFAAGIVGVASVIASRRPRGDYLGDIFASLAITSGIAVAGIGAFKVLAGSPTPTWGFK